MAKSPFALTKMFCMDLNEFFVKYRKVAVAFSGGVDSAYLLYAALKYAKQVQAYYVKSAFQPQFEYTDALSLCGQLGTQMKTINIDVLASERIAANPQNRCYFCKKQIFTAILQQAKADGFTVLLDGTNASDNEADRPGVKALHELSVLSPLKLCGLDKEKIRKLSQEAGLFTWNKPAYACLATRIPTGEQITEEKLKATEAAEDFLFSLGLSDFRVRKMGTAAKIQVVDSQINKVIENKERIISELKKYYSAVLLDLEVRE